MPKKTTSKTVSSRVSKKTTKKPVFDSTVKNSKKSNDKSLFEKLQFDMEENQSYLNLVLGALIVIVLGVLLYNYFNKPAADLGPSQQSQVETQGDVEKDKLPGKYTVKEGDTLFKIAAKYYDDGYKYTKLVEANKLQNENSIEVGKVLDIPKLDDSGISPSASTEMTLEPSSSPESSDQPSPSASASDQPTPAASAEPSATPSDTGIVSTDTNMNSANVNDNQPQWGDKISGDTYTVAQGDWLSKIAGRAYGDVMAFDKIAKANNISNPDEIEIGTVLKIPR